MALSPGSRLGAYDIAARIGAGGMGEVYRATDGNLKRQVAIKVLPEDVAADAERLARFRREAEVLASLNHPNIAIIHGLEKIDGVTALVMELVEGPTLAEAIQRRARSSGPAGLPIDEALAIAAQIAEALEDAHEHGIVHRDLKPANIKLRPDGTVKVLDFGLAKALEPARAAPNGISQSPTLTAPAMTRVGVILGTAAYMSPEQARGEAVDHRTDIWAFGCVLYEMLTGRMAFGAATTTETLAKVLEGHADLNALPAATPPAIRRLVRRCLERAPRNRVQHIGDARADIGDVRAGESAETGVPIVPEAARRPGAIVSVAAALGLAMFLAAGVWIASRLITEEAATVPIRFDVARVEGPRPVSTRTIALSPNGSRLVYETLSSLRMRAIGGEDVPLPGGGSGPFFSPDGQWLAFFAEDGLRRMPADGGGLELVSTERAGREREYGGSWGPDGTIVFSRGGGLLRVSAQGGETTIVAEPDTTAGEVRYAWPEFLPGGQSVLFTVVRAGGSGEARISVIDLSTRQQKTLLQGGHAARYLATGHLLYASGGRLRIVGFDEQRLETRGVPATVEGIALGGSDGFNTDFAVSDTGTLAYAAPASPVRRTMAWVDRAGREEPIPAPPATYIYPRISPDGTRVALDIGGAGRDIWVWNFARATLTQISKGPTEDLMPVWNPDGTRVYYGSDRVGRTFRVFSVAADGAGIEREELAGQDSHMPMSMPTPDQLITYASGRGAGAAGDVAIATLGQGAQARTLLGGEGVQGSAEVSPDGRLIAYQSNETKVAEVYVRPYPDVDRRREQISLGGGFHPLWGQAGSNELFYWTPMGMLKVVSVWSTPDLRIGPSRDVQLGEGFIRPVPGSSWTYAVSPVDGRLLLLKPVPGSGGPAPIKIVVNWFEELKR